MIVEAALGILTLGLSLALFLLFKLKSCRDYWPRRGVKAATFPSMFPMGNSVNTCFTALFSRANKWDLAQEQAMSTIINSSRNRGFHVSFSIGQEPPQ